MKKILSSILFGLFLNLMFCPSVLALEETPAVNSGADNTAVETTTNNSEAAATNVQTEDTAVQTENVNSQPVNTVSTNDNTQGENVSAQENTEKTEHLSIRKNKSKKVSVESVYIESHGVEIPAQDILQVAFVNDFNGRRAQVGDTIEFRFPNDIVTQEGTMIIPSTARIVAEITKLKKPKPLHLSGKVYLDFKYIEINGTRKPIQARLCGKKEYLSRKSLNNTVAVGETVVTTGAGSATGALIAGASGNLFMLIFGTSIGAGIGALAGLGVGILLPGASFKAKAGQRVEIQLTQELDI